MVEIYGQRIKNYIEVNSDIHLFNVRIEDNFSIDKLVSPSKKYTFYGIVGNECSKAIEFIDRFDLWDTTDSQKTEKEWYTGLLSPQLNTIRIGLPDYKLQTLYNRAEQQKHDKLPDNISSIFQLLQDYIYTYFYKDDYTIEVNYNYNYGPNTPKCLNDRVLLIIECLNEAKEQIINGKTYTMEVTSDSILLDGKYWCTRDQLYRFDGTLFIEEK